MCYFLRIIIARAIITTTTMAAMYVTSSPGVSGVVCVVVELVEDIVVSMAWVSVSYDAVVDCYVVVVFVPESTIPIIPKT